MTENKITNTAPIARNPRGFNDIRGANINRIKEVTNKILATYSIWGFETLETGALEYADCLGKFLPDSDRPNEGVFAFQDDDDEWLALRYDLTAPLARFVAQNFDALPKPYRRCAAGSVWRNEKPGPGRYREFIQCDADIIGSNRPEADGEVIAMLATALEAVGLKREEFCVKISNRKLLDALLEEIGIDINNNVTRLAILRSIDKMDRLGAEGVRDLLGKGRKDPSGDFTKGAGLLDAQIDKVLEFTHSKQEKRSQTLEKMAQIIGNNILASQALEELKSVDLLLTKLGYDDKVCEFDPAIVRGLEYYTGTVFEAEFLGQTKDEKGNLVRFGSVGSGGRYDDLVMRFRGERVPATGCSIGVSRLLAALDCAGHVQNDSIGPVIILCLDNDQIQNYFKMAQELRDNGIVCEVYLGTSGMKAQMKYADRKNAPAVIIEGSNEREKGIVTIKDLNLGAQISQNISDNQEWRNAKPAQIEVARNDIISAIQVILTKSK